MIKIQFQDHDGNWRTVMTTGNNSQLITARMRELKNNQPNRKIRAIDGNGCLIDLLD
jgi:hypothetical protein